MKWVYIKWLQWAFRTMPGAMDNHNHEFNLRFWELRGRLLRSPAFNNDTEEENHE